MRHTIISAFVNLTAGTLLFRPGSETPHVLGMRERVTPPGKFESHDAEQVARLIRARCLKASDTAVQAPAATDGPETDLGVSPPLSGEAVSHALPNPDAPSANAPGEAAAPRVDGGPSDANGGAAGVKDGSTAAGTGAPGPIAGAGDGITVGDPNASSPPAGSGVSPPATDDTVSPPVAVTSPATPPAPAPAKRTASKGGAGSANVAGKDGGGSGDGTVSNRERRRLAREAAAKRD